MKRSSVLDFLFGAPTKMRASPKDYDPGMNQERLGWEVHAASCEYIGNFNTYYHMSKLQFETLYVMVGAALERCPIKGKNAMPPKGTCQECSDSDIKAAIDYMVPKK